jgi:hypothetical protein
MMGFAYEFKVNNTMYETIQKAPKKIGHMYLFGKKYPYETYQFMGEHGNDGAQTGFVDLDNFDKNIDVSSIVINEFKDDRVARRKVRKQVPHILFLGETYGGDLGAILYAHYKGKNIDSLIISVDPLFGTD